MRRASDPAPAFASVHTLSGQKKAPAAKDYSLRRMLPAGNFVAAEDIEFGSIAESSETAGPGQLLIYRSGEQDPAKVMADAMARGVAGLLTEQLLPCPVPQCVVGDAESASATIWSQILGEPDRKLISVGIVGSAGKSTTALLVANLFRKLGARSAYQTDLGQSDGVVQEASGHRVLRGESLVRWLGDACDCDCQVAIVEIAEDAMRHGHYDCVQFDLLVVTGTVHEQDDYGPSALQCAIERLTPEGVVVAPADDKRAMRMVIDSGVRRVTYGVRGAADVTAKIIDQADGMSTLFLGTGDTTAVMETPLRGVAMAANHAAAATVGVLVDQPLYWIAETLGTLRSVPGRMQSVPDPQHASVVIDAAGSSHRAATALRQLRSERNGGRLWCVLAIDGTESADELASYGDLLERHADHAILTCRSESKPSFLQLSHKVLDGVRECAALRLVANHQRAVRWAIAEAAPRDTILVLGGITRNSAQQQRAELERLQQWIREERAALDEALAKQPRTEPSQQDSSAPSLKIVG